MNLPGVLLRRWNMPAHFMRTSMSSRFRSSHLVFPSLQKSQSMLFQKRVERGCHFGAVCVSLKTRPSASTKRVAGVAAAFQSEKCKPACAQHRRGTSTLGKATH